MIDIHNHLLPGIDDGAADIDTSIKLAKIAAADGITHLVCTPHIHLGRYDNTISTIAAAKHEFERALQAHGVDLQVATAAEIRFDIEWMPEVAAGGIPMLGQWQGRKVLLLEFPHGAIPFAAEQLTAWLIARDIVPMIAHPERNKGLLATPSKLKPFLEQGCLLQLTAGSVAGRFGKPVRKLATELLEQGLVTVLASDAHNINYRPPVLTEGLAAAVEIIGEEAAHKLVQDNPWQIAECHF
ncbi:MAG: CpsB/CapC family capsule biosynthesis tyrosine phosphatase [Porticoccaceae bacterium]